MGMAGALPISFSEMKAWAEMTGAEPSYWEISVIERMDVAALAAMHKKGAVDRDESAAHIDANDSREVIGFMRSLGARREAGANSLRP